MLTATGAYITEQRRARHLTLGQLAAAIGYTNVAKGARRILALERDGDPVAGLLEKVVHALGLDSHHVQELVAEAADASKRTGNAGPASRSNRNYAAV
jgi:hypothetical protein